MVDNERVLGPKLDAQWREIPHNRMSALWTEIAKLKISEGREWTIGVVPGALLLFTDLPHADPQPDGKSPFMKVKTFELPLIPMAQALAEKLLED